MGIDPRLILSADRGIDSTDERDVGPFADMTSSALPMWTRQRDIIMGEWQSIGERISEWTGGS